MPYLENTLLDLDVWGCLGEGKLSYSQIITVCKLTMSHFCASLTHTCILYASLRCVLCV